MDSEDGTRIFRELTIAHRICCRLDFSGRRYMIIVPLYALRHSTEHLKHVRLPDVRDLNEEEEGIVIGLANRANLIVETDRDRGFMVIW